MKMDTVVATVQPLVGYLQEHLYLKAFLVLILAIVLAKVVDFLVTKVLQQWVEKTKTTLDDHLVAIVHTPIYLTTLLVGVGISISMLELPDTAHKTILAILLTVAIFIWSLFFIRLTKILLRHFSRDRRDQFRLIRNQTLPLFENLMLVVILALALYFVFYTWKIDMTAWLASAGIAGIAVGFAAKDTLANLFAGVFILADAPYQIGDFVVLESGERGEVTHIGIRSTRILTRDDIEITIPNSIMGNTMITNESGGPHTKHRIRAQVSVAYGSDIDQVRDILLSAAAEQESVCKDPEPRVRFRTFGQSGLDLELLCWVDQPILRGRVLDRLNSTVYRYLNEADIEIPYTKQDLYIKSMPENWPPQGPS